MKRPSIGFYKFSCCAGCEFMTIYFQRHILETLENCDFVFCRMLSSAEEPDTSLDIALVEGAITEAWQADELIRIREKTRYLFAIGSCAVNGGIPAIKATLTEHEVQKRVYKDLSNIHSIRPHAINTYVRVDGNIMGCPPDEEGIIEALASVAFGKKPDFREYSVCIECKIKGNICLLVSDSKPCMGPVTNAGCSALCPSNGRPCYSCFGPMSQANATALAKRFEMMGLTREDIKRKFSEFGADTPQFRRVIEQHED